ncbi:hypothetical protein D3C78_1918620 [compost metagenome]
MLTTTDLTVEKINSLLKAADEFSKGKTVKAKEEIYVSNLFLKTARAQKPVSTLLSVNWD